MGRKRCIQSLEYFDSAGESRRSPDNALAHVDAQ
ncbi:MULTISPECIES: SelB C-terminal domain-containing protein [Pseudomonas]